MAIDLTQEQRETGKENFARTADGLTRRGFMKSMVAGAAIVPVSAAVYYGYKSLGGKPVKAAIIGCGDEGGVLVGEHNPEFLEFVACCDIRPTNKRRIFTGEPTGPRKGFKRIYGNNADKQIKVYEDYARMLRDNPAIEAVVIALPLHLHASVAIDCMRIGKDRSRPVHVLCEKLMAWNIGQCKKMIEVAHVTKSILSIGHQRHYSLLYAHAHEVLQSGVIGDVKHIRAQWHRNNSWPYKASDSSPALVAGMEPQLRDGWCPAITQEDYDALNDPAKLKKYGNYESVEQLVRWRLYNKTGNGLMAELGSHQLDASSIFLGKVHPLAVTGVGGTYFYGHRDDKGEIDRPGPNARQSDDHVFVTYEFPGKNHPKGPNKGTDESDIVIVTYSSINTNGFEPYGETVMGTRGTMIVEKEESVLLYQEPVPGKKSAGPNPLAVAVVSTGKGPALESSSTSGPSSARPTGTGAAVSKGYREEMEDFAFCIRQWSPSAGYEKDEKTQKYTQRLPRCHGEVAMADAIIALTANRSMREKQRIEFKDGWFDAKDQDVPDTGEARKPKMEVE